MCRLASIGLTLILTAGSAAEPDLKRALASLDSAFTGELVRVEDGKSHLKVWVD